MTAFTWALCSAVFDDNHSRECWMTTAIWPVSLAVFDDSFYLAVCSTAFDDNHSRECWMTTAIWPVSLAVFDDGFYLAVCSTAFDDNPSRECWMMIVCCWAACHLLEQLVWQALMTVLLSKEPFAVVFGKNVSTWPFWQNVLATTVIEIFEIVLEIEPKSYAGNVILGFHFKRADSHRTVEGRGWKEWGFGKMDSNPHEIH